MPTIEETTGFTQVYDIHERDSSEASKRLADKIQTACEDFLEINFTSGGCRMAEMNIRIANAIVGMIQFRQIDDVTFLNFLWIEESCRGYGIGSWVIKELTKRKVYFILRPAPLTIYNSNSWNGKYLPLPNITQLKSEKFQLKEEKSADKVEKLIKFYEKCGLKRCRIQGSDKLFLCNWQFHAPGYLSFID